MLQGNPITGCGGCGGVKAEALGDSPNDLKDKRDAIIEKMSELANISMSRTDKDEIIVYIALGIWGEYAAILPEVFRKAKTLSLGQGLPCSH